MVTSFMTEAGLRAVRALKESEERAAPTSCTTTLTLCVGMLAVRSAWSTDLGRPAARESEPTALSASAARKVLKSGNMRRIISTR